MLINLSNHPSSLWSSEQLKAAEQYGDIVDVPFPNVDPYATEHALSSLVAEYYAKVESIGSPNEVIVHLMGEFCFTYSMLNLLKKHGYKCIASTTNRRVVLEDGIKKVYFDFCTFRKYWDW